MAFLREFLQGGVTDYGRTMPPFGGEPRPDRVSVSPMTQATHPTETDIQQFYKGATVFVTGGTGFVGQLLIEKLLRSCPDIKKVYVMARPKKTKDIQTRLREQFKDVIYDNLRQVNPNFESQVEAVAGDCGEIGLGISNDDRTSLVNEVSVIFHSAATVRFDEPLKVAVEINTRGTREMVQLARDCKNLKAFVHVSTAYSNCNRPEIEEKFYDIEMPGEKLIDMVENMDEGVVNRITPQLILGHPNTYTYTKRAAEDIVRERGQHMPCAVVRPSIIVGTAKEPVAGWSGNLYGLGGVFLGSGLGVIRTMRAEQYNVKDIVPADMVSNTCIAVAWKTARLFRKNAAVEPRVYMCGTSPRTPIILKTFNDKCLRKYEEMPSCRAIYKYISVVTPSLWKVKVYELFLHWIPAYVLDAAFVLGGKRPPFKKIYTKVGQMMDVLSFFGLNTWIFHNENTVQLYNEMSKSDRTIFAFDFEHLDWDSYVNAYVRGVRYYLMKDPEETIPQGKIRRKQLEVLHWVVCSVLVLSLYGMFKLLAMLFS